MNAAQEQFVDWLRKNQPNVYKAAIDEVGIGLGEKDTWWDSFIGAAKELVPVIVGARSQKKILDVQLRRAEQGLPPLNTQQISPTVRVQAGLTPDMKRLVLPALLGITALVAFMVWKKR